MLRRFKQCLNNPEEVRKTEYSNSPHVEKGKFIIRTIFKETHKGAEEMVQQTLGMPVVHLHTCWTIKK